MRAGRFIRTPSRPMQKDVEPSSTPPAVDRGSPLQRWLRVMVGGWGVTLVIAIAQMTRHELTPSSAAVTYPQFSGPIDAFRQPAAVLVVVLHPECPCSGATLAQASAMARRSTAKLEVAVIVTRPAGYDGRLQDSPMWAAAVDREVDTIEADEDGRLAARFDAKTSGQAFLYDVDGKLRFSGGLTAGRGVDRPAASALRAIESLASPADTVLHSPVFGCSLR